MSTLATGMEAFESPKALLPLERYQYCQLKEASKCIRLFKIKGRCSDVLLEGELHEVVFAENTVPNYTALSYTWGDPEGEEYAVLINGKTLHVRENLFAFLALSKPSWHQRKLLWIDAICIDQSNVAERNKQVSIMGKIYQTADSVCVWLGYRDSSASELFEYVASRKPIPNPIEPEFHGLYADAGRQDLEEEAQLASSLACGVLQLALSTYWKRLWVIQEVTLARDISFCYGEEQISSAAFERAAEKLAKALYHPGNRLEGMRFLMSFRETMHLRMTSLLPEIRKTQCSDPHDRIYGILSLVPYTALFPVDYRSTGVEVLLETLAFILRTEEQCLNNLTDLRWTLERIISYWPSAQSYKVTDYAKHGLSRISSNAYNSRASNIPVTESFISSKYSTNGKRNKGWMWKPLSFFLSLDEPMITDSIGELDHSNSFPCRNDLQDLCPLLKGIDRALIFWNYKNKIFLILVPSTANDDFADVGENATLEQPPKTFVVQARGQLRSHLFINNYAEKDEGCVDTFEIYDDKQLGGCAAVLTTEQGVIESRTKKTKTGQSRRGLVRRLDLVFSDTRAQLTLFGLPEPQGLRQAAMNLMARCGGDSNLPRTRFYSRKWQGGKVYRKRSNGQRQPGIFGPWPDLLPVPAQDLCEPQFEDLQLEPRDSGAENGTYLLDIPHQGSHALENSVKGFYGLERNS